MHIGCVHRLKARAARRGANWRVLNLPGPSGGVEDDVIVGGNCGCTRAIVRVKERCWLPYHNHQLACFYLVREGFIAGP
jgi:hypothetical protein